MTTEPVVSRRYNDRDIEADFARLHSIATAYLMRYSGTFQVLRASKAIIATGDFLTVEQLRVVCNCMIHDMQVTNMPEPIGHTLVFDASQHVADTGGTVFAFPSGERVQPPTQKGKWLDLVAHPNPRKPYWYSTQVNAYLIHIIQSVRVTYRNALWYDNQNWYDTVPPFHLRFEVRPHFFCKKLNSIPSKMRAAGPDEIKELIEGGRRWCSICESLWYAIPEAPTLPS